MAIMRRRHDLDPKNNNLPRLIDVIYLRAIYSLQGGQQVMDLQTGRVSRGSHCENIR